MPAPEQATKQGFAEMLMQLAVPGTKIVNAIKPLLDQPVIRFPHTMSNRVALTIAAGVTGQAFVQTDFTNAMEWPFEIHYMKPTQDPAHTFADWRLGVKDTIFAQYWPSNDTQLVSSWVEDNTGIFRPNFPWIVRPKGGALTLTADNLDTVNPIQVNVDFVGAFLVPRA